MKLSRLSIPYRAVRNSGSIALVMVLSGGFSVQEITLTALAVIAAAAGAIILINTFWAYLVWKNYSYMVEGQSLKLSHGVIRKKDRKIPLKRIQNVDIQRNIVQRALNIAEVSLETAGGNKTEASLKYLDLEDARKLRDSVRQEESKEEETGTEEEPIYEISDRELLILSATSVDGRVLAAIAAVFGIAPTLIGGVMDEANLGLTAGSVLLFTGLAGVTWISSAVSTFLRYWGFKLHDREDSLEYERGLLNRAEGNIPLNKIQKLSMEENVLQRIAGYATLKIDTAGYSPSQSMEKGSEAAVPLAKNMNLMELAQDIGEVQKPEWKNISSRARRRYVFRYMIASVLGSTAVYLVFNSLALAGAVLLLLTPVSAVAGHLKWSNRGYQVGENHAVTVNGFWNRKLNFIPYFRVQNLIETRTVLQRKWGLSNIDIDTAGTGNLLNRTVIQDMDAAEAGQIKKEIYRRFQNSLR